MLNLPKFRLAALAALAMSVFQLNTAQAAVHNAWDQCDEEALGVLIGVCDVIMDGDWDIGVIVYTCDEDGHLDQFSGICVSQT